MDGLSTRTGNWNSSVGISTQWRRAYKLDKEPPHSISSFASDL